VACEQPDSAMGKYRSKTAPNTIARFAMLQIYRNRRRARVQMLVDEPR
jgi:hypothetical protein